MALSPLNCIALRTVKVSDSRNLLSVWTRQHGRLTLAMPAGNTPEARRRKALTVPLAVFDCIADVRPGKDIISVRDITAAPLSLAVAGSPVKNLTAMFLAELLDLLLKRSDADERLSDFLFYSLETLALLDGSAAVANFHLVFLFRLAWYAGIAPDLSGWHRHAVFDLREGAMRNSLPLHHDFIAGRELSALMALSRADYSSAARLPFGRSERNRALDFILDYYSMHLTSLSSLKSLDVLRMMLE
ncbi:MAG: hypothetical protein HDS65_06585 [Bacteroidales bacterium]|nr:hypothetical protein [Bacteroidales bacterium]